MLTDNVSEGIVLAIEIFEDLDRILLVFVATLIIASKQSKFLNIFTLKSNVKPYSNVCLTASSNENNQQNFVK